MTAQEDDRLAEVARLRQEIRRLEAEGVDVARVMAALMQTPAERIASNDEALKFFADIKVFRAGERGRLKE